MPSKKSLPDWLGRATDHLSRSQDGFLEQGNDISENLARIIT
jgi:hypothetical protein